MDTTAHDDLRARLERLESENRKIAGRLRLGVIAGAGLLGLAALTLLVRPGEARPQDPGGGLIGGGRSSFARIGSTLVNFDHVTHVKLQDPNDPRAGLTVHYSGGDQQDRFEGDDAAFVARWMVGTGSGPPLGEVREGLGRPRDADAPRDGGRRVVPPPDVDPGEIPKSRPDGR